MTDNNSTAYYLEVSPYVTYPATAWASSGFTNTSIAGTETGIGTGRKNTALILATDTNAPAALACRNYGTDYSQYTGKNDWFLPSDGELSELWRYKVATGTYDTQTDPNFFSWNWTSSQASGTNGNQYANSMVMNQVGTYALRSKTNTCYNWAVRAF
jgi:hypothetical protein